MTAGHRVRSAGTVAWAIALMLLLAERPGDLEAAPAGKSCLTACRRDRQTCLGVARQRRASAQAACTGDGATRRTCRRAAAALLRRAKPACRDFQRQCKRCCRAGGTGAACPVGRPVRYEPPPPQDLTALKLPRLSSGRLFALAVPGAQLEIDPERRTPLSALGGCGRWISTCVEAGVRSLDDCARSAPPCLTDAPWQEPAACCPAACFAAYRAARESGGEALDAFRTVYFRDASCFPGVRALLGR